MTLTGDSISNLCWGTGTELNQGVVSRSYYEWANTALRAAGIDLECRSNLGVGSKTISQVVAEQYPTAFADSNDILWTNFGINDLNSTLGNTPTDTIISQLRSAVASVASNKAVGVFNSINPISQAGISGARPRVNEIPLINAAFEAICAEYQNIIFLNTYKELIDPASPALNPITNSMQTDGIHPTSLGAQLMANAPISAFPRRLKLTPLYAKGPNLLPTISSGSGGTTTPGAGTISGTIPAGWNVAVAAGSATVVCSYTSPNSFRLVITNTGGAASTVRVQLADGAAFASNFTLADRIAFEADLKTQGAVLLNRLNTSFSFNGATNWFGLGQASDETNFTYPQAAFAGRYKTRPYLLSTLGSLSSVLPIISVNVGATTGAVTLDIANPQVYKV